MTNISSALQVPSIRPTAGLGESNLRSTTNGSDFEFRLTVQSTIHPQPPEPYRAKVLTELNANMARRPDVEAMLQSLAWRKTVSTPNKTSQSVPLRRASGLTIPNYSFPDHDFLAANEIIKLASAQHYGSAPYSPLMDDLDALMTTPDEGNFTTEIIDEGGLNAFAIAVALSSTTLTWMPTEIIRAPLQAPRIRNSRLRKPYSQHSNPLDQSRADAGHNHGNQE